MGRPARGVMTVSIAPNHRHNGGAHVHSHPGTGHPGQCHPRCRLQRAHHHAHRQPDRARQSDATTATTKYQDAGATASWNTLATSLADRVPVDQARMYAYLGMAQYRAAIAADDAGREQHSQFRELFIAAMPIASPISAAIGGASAAVLNVILPGERRGDRGGARRAAGGQPPVAWSQAAMISRPAEALGPCDRRPGPHLCGGRSRRPRRPRDATRGPRLREVEAARPNRARQLSGTTVLPDFGQPILPLPPTFVRLGGLSHGARRSAPDFGTRTAEQLAIAVFWNLQQSGRRNAVFNGEAVELVRKYHLGDARGRAHHVPHECGRLRCRYRAALMPSTTIGSSGRRKRTPSSRPSGRDAK